MIDILTETNEEYEQMCKLTEGVNDISIKRPEQSIGMVVWSIDDAKSEDIFPEGTPDEVIYAAMKRIERTIREDMTARGFETIDILEDELLEGVESITVYECYHCEESSTANAWDEVTYAAITALNVDTENYIHVEQAVEAGLNDDDTNIFHVCPKCKKKCYLSESGKKTIYAESKN